MRVCKQHIKRNKYIKILLTKFLPLQNLKYICDMSKKNISNKKICLYYHHKFIMSQVYMEESGHSARVVNKGWWEQILYPISYRKRVSHVSTQWGVQNLGCNGLKGRKKVWFCFKEFGQHTRHSSVPDTK